jgi:predicted glutamine amidotransferase
MCRWAAYFGSDLYLEDIITSPCHSLIAQSHHAVEAKTATNGDGFGVAWYGNRAEPGLYRDLLPAWSDQNLRSLARQINSRLFLAHVRAATGAETSRANCHPFVFQQWSFMHNGQIGSFDRLRRPLEMLLPDALYSHKNGSTDSELFFLLMLHFGLNDNPVQALERTVQVIYDVAQSLNVPPFIRLTAAFSNGRSLFAVRYASDQYAPTLYTAKMASSSGVCVVSEPLDGVAENWMSVPRNSFVTIDTPNHICIEPFMDSAREQASAAALTAAE